MILTLTLILTLALPEPEPYPEQFRRLAQQQLLFQMALAAQATSRLYLAHSSPISPL